MDQYCKILGDKTLKTEQHQQKETEKKIHIIKYKIKFSRQSGPK